MDEITFRYAGDQAILAEFKNEISIETNRNVRSLHAALSAAGIFGVGELVPTYRALLIHYDPLKISPHELIAAVKEYSGHLEDVSLPKAIVTEIPVCYEGEYALDIEHIAQMENTTVENVIQIHSQSDYFVYMLGFSPGHAYTARMENPFSFKRLDTPRLRIPGGSIAVQLALSNIIPLEQPCGWNIIGTTPLLTYDPRRQNPFLLQSGQWVHYVPVSRSDFEAIKADAERGTYVCRTYEKEDS